jgi:hypothetical protein
MRKIVFIIFLFPLYLMAQISEGGIPLGYEQHPFSKDHRMIELPTPDVEAARNEDRRTQDEILPYRIGLAIDVDIDVAREGRWKSAAGRSYFSFGIRSEGAEGLILYYSRFSVPEGGRFFIYSGDGSQLIGAFTSANNPAGGHFATEVIRGDELILEYDPPAGSKDLPDIRIYQVHYVYQKIDVLQKGLSGPCEVNINCPEGQAWQNEKQGVAKIVLKAGQGTYLCTGTLINNVRQDSTPYLLTARHCGSTASLSDYSQWVFHFNFEALNCEDPPENPPSSTITGSSLLAQAPSGTNAGSDFKLLLLNQKIPEQYNPYFAGWNRDGNASPFGVCIHHPRGDIKKISTYDTPLISAIYGQTSENPNGYYWKVIWEQTESGHGVTEGGSSGSAIFDNTGKIVGTLTGGFASCDEPLQPDYYGKFSYHWESNGSPGGAQLRPYLDPDNTGRLSLDGFSYGNRLVANFAADTTVVSVGGLVRFTDRSGGSPDFWNWSFPGGSPSESAVSDAGSIRYLDYGYYDVSLVVGSASQADTLIRKEYIRVTPNIYPNPVDTRLTLDFGRRELTSIKIELIDHQGRIAREFQDGNVVSGIYSIPVDDIPAGIYILRVSTNIQVDHMPVMIY